jgi:hypothetical protein
VPFHRRNLQYPCYARRCASSSDIQRTATINVFLFQKRRYGALSVSVSSNNQIKTKDIVHVRSSMYRLPVQHSIRPKQMNKNYTRVLGRVQCCDFPFPSYEEYFAFKNLSRGYSLYISSINRICDYHQQVHK